MDLVGLLTVAVGVLLVVGLRLQRRRNARLVAERALSDPDPALRRIATILMARRRGTAGYADLLVDRARSERDPGVTRPASGIAHTIIPGHESAPPGDAFQRRLKSGRPPSAPHGGETALMSGSGTSALKMLATVVGAVTVATLTLLVSVSADTLSGFPKGYDAWGHFSKTELLMSTFPQVEWNYAWYGGLPYFQGSYPPLYHALVGVISAVTGAAVPSVMVVVAGVSLVIVSVCVYGFVRLISGGALAAVAAALLVLATPAFWALAFGHGMYPRLTALAFLAVGMLAAAWDVRSPRRLTIVAAAVAIAASLSSHPIVGITGTVLVTAVLAIAPGTPRRSPALRATGFFGTTCLLSAYFYLPLLLLYRGQSTFVEYPPLPPRNLFWHARELDAGAIDDSLPPVLVPLCLALGGAVLVRREKCSLLPFPLRVATICTGLALAWLAYAFVGHLGISSVNGMTPQNAVVLVGMLLAVGVGICLGSAVGRGVTGRLLTRTVAVAAGVSVVVTLPSLPNTIRPIDGPRKRAIMDLLPSDIDEERNHRVAGPLDETTDWINARYDVPQTRGYQVQGVRNLNWQVWLDVALQQPTWPPEERRFLLDWYAVKWLYAGYGPTQRRPYESDRAAFAALAPKPATGFQAYEHRHAGPILTARATRTALIIGQRPNYEFALRSLAAANQNSERIIPIRGGGEIDRYSLSQLRQFDAVILYGPSVRDDGKAARLLSRYVREGGGLVIEAADSSMLLNRLAGRSAPIPVLSTEATVIGGSWNFRPRPSKPVADIRFDRFDPPVYGRDAPWTAVTPTARRHWAHPVLSAHRRDVVVEGRYGRGRVIWSGLNLPYHAAVFQNRHEGAFLGQMVAAAARTRPARPARFDARFVNAEQRRVTMHAGGTGVLLKETWSPSWHASVSGRDVPIYRAGPDMMYVPVPPASTRRPASVAFEYRAPTVEWLGRCITALAGVGVLLFLAHVPAPTRTGVSRLLRSRRRRASGEI